MRRPRFLLRLGPILGVLTALAAPPLHARETVEGRFLRALGDMQGGARRGPVALVLAMWEAQELSSLVPRGAERLLAAIERLEKRDGGAARLPHVLAEARMVVGKSALQSGRPTAAPLSEAGVPTRGLVLGPFGGPSPRSPPPPAAGGAAGTFAGKHGATGWRPFSVGATATIPVSDYLPSYGDAHAFVGFAFETPRADARIILGSNGPMVAMLDGQPLLSFEGERDAADWQHDRVVRLAAGVHWLEIGIGHRTLAPALAVRVLYDRGAGVPRYLDAREPPAATAGWSPAPGAASGLMALARSPREVAELTSWIEPSPPSERQAAVLFERLIATAAARPHPRDDELAELHYLLGRAESTDVSRAIAAFEAADRLAGGHAQALAALIDLAQQNGLPARADELARRLASFDPRHPVVIGQRMLRRFQLADALAALPLMPSDLPDNARLAALEATLSESAGDYTRAGRAYRRLAMAQGVSSETGETGEVLQRAVQNLLRAVRHDEANEALQAALRVRPMSADLLILRARTRAVAATDLAPVIAELDAERAFHHQNPLYEEMRGRLLLLGGERGQAIEAFDRALELAPQNRELAGYRSSLVAERGLAERWAEPVEALLARSQAAPRRSEGALTLLEKSVTEVFDSGLASQFRQLAVRIEQQSAAERFDDMLFAFTPGEDRLEVLEAEILRADLAGNVARIRPQQVGDQYQRGKSEGVYTLTAYKVIRFPALQAGDIVHIQLRKDEIGSRNLFGDFFGLVYPMSAEFPKAHAEAVVIAPATRPLYHHAARLPPPEVTRDGDTQVLRFAVDNLPGLTIEPSMPGYGDVGAWVSVSTFESWQALANWYRELVRPQLEMPPDLTRTARGLIAGVTDVEARVAAIHRWVVTRTRYVGIEFGIHGFKPYKMSEVVQRGYGDCKDKAALLVAMLRAVDIEAEFVLVRTRDLGALEGTPATLWAFNHAIAYIPALDVYLDGTAESAGLRELPDLDQGAQVLRIDLFSQRPPELTQVPLQPPKDNAVTASTRFVLEPDGDATAELSERVRGTSAGRLRARLQDESRRDAIIAEVIAGQHPGTALEAASYDNLDTLGEPVTIRAKVHLPRLATRQGNTLELPLVLDPGSRLVDMAPLAERKQALVLRQTELEDSRDTYVLPAGAKVVGALPDIDIRSRFGRWSMRAHASDGTIEVESQWEIPETRIEAADYPEFRRFLEDVAKAENVRVRIDL